MPQIFVYVTETSSEHMNYDSQERRRCGVVGARKFAKETPDFDTLDLCSNVCLC